MELEEKLDEKTKHLQELPQLSRPVAASLDETLKKNIMQAYHISHVICGQPLWLGLKHQLTNCNKNKPTYNTNTVVSVSAPFEFLLSATRGKSMACQG